MIRRWVAEYGNAHGIEVWAWWNNGTGQWEIDFERVDAGPGVADVRAAITGHPVLGRHAGDPGEPARGGRGPGLPALRHAGCETVKRGGDD